MRKHFFELLALLLVVGGLVFFGECIYCIGQRDYLGALLLTIIGIAVLNVGAELARLALIERDPG